MTQTISATLPASTVYVSGTVNDMAVTWTNVGGEIWEAVADRAEDNIYVVAPDHRFRVRAVHKHVLYPVLWSFKSDY